MNNNLAQNVVGAGGNALRKGVSKAGDLASNLQSLAMNAYPKVRDYVTEPLDLNSLSYMLPRQGYNEATGQMTDVPPENLMNPTLGGAARLMSPYLMPSFLANIPARSAARNSDAFAGKFIRFPESPNFDAKFIGVQDFNVPDLGITGPKLNLFNIIKKGHPQEGSTVTEDTLRVLGLKYPTISDKLGEMQRLQ